MNIETLNYFIKMAEYKNLSSVSKKYHISQSALSQQLSNLENKLDTKLLNRSNKGVTLTPEGEILFTHAKSIINSYNKLIKDINNLKLEKKYLSIDAIESLASTIMPSILKKFTKAFNYDNIILHTVDSFSPLNLTKHICDLYIGYINPMDLDNWTTYKIGEEEFILIAHKSFPKDSITSNEILKIPIINRSNKPLIKYSLNEEFSIDNSDKLNIVCTTNSNTSALNATIAFKAVTFMPKNMADMYCTNDFKQIKINDLKLHLPIYLICSQDFSSKNPSIVKFFKNNLKSFLQE